MDILSVTDEFFKALGKRDKTTFFSYLCSDIVVEHPARPKGNVKGKPALEKIIDSFFNWVEDGKVEVLRMVKSENTVWTERKDIWKIEEKWIEIPIAGIFEFQGDKISRWVEYLDFGYMNAFKTRPEDKLHKD